MLTESHVGGIQGLVAFIRPVEPFVTKIKIFDSQNFALIELKKSP